MDLQDLVQVCHAVVHTLFTRSARMYFIVNVLHCQAVVMTLRCVMNCISVVGWVPLLELFCSEDLLQCGVRCLGVCH